jgi:hypothetical protein
MNVKGKIKEIGEIQTIGANGFRKRCIVVTEEGQYPNDIAIDFVQDKCEILNQYKINQSVDIGINLRSNSSNGKWFTNVVGWKISILENEPQF